MIDVTWGYVAISDGGDAWLGDDDEITTADSAIAVIGCGVWGRNHVRVLSELGVLKAIVEPDSEAAELLRAEYGVPVRSFTDVLSAKDIQAVVISAPAFQHYDLTRRAILAGKHVLVEKPLALRVEDARELCALAEEQGVILMVGHLLRYHPAFETLSELVKSGRLGRLRYIYSNRLSLGKIRREENILWSFAPHDISMILALMQNEEPDRVYAEGSKFLHRDIADSTLTTLTFPGGQYAHIFVSWLHPFKDQRLVVIGDEGMAQFNDGDAWEEKISIYPHRIDWHEQLPTPHKAERQFVPIENPGEPLRLQAEHFLDCIRNGNTPKTDGWEALRVLQVLDAAERAMKSGQSIRYSYADKNTALGSSVRIHETATVDSPSEIGSGTKIWHYSHVLRDVRIGKNCVIGQNVMIGANVNIGNGCKIQNNVSVYTGVTLEDGVFCGPSCVFTNVINPRAEIERKDEFKPTLVRRGATIGANATIVCGVTIGRYALIGAGAVVTSEVPDFALMTGVPARRTGWVSRSGEKLGEDLVCPRTGDVYQLSEEGSLFEVEK